ncbi:MAM domain-containing glycosylphosphatidylinositol anchor protein 2-like [Sinocyclocheilus rhinocerous]|uniref:MAM domain-containing glycosylphosphatidylinositol anchor protein 2-like n=1 Tax=Sinocyclocheilus rhinocerous TaxID=307959 RepID=UPI0007B95433|nr:PREDICTED: MAM domain-containing glycosylphosphatidylinositol anchor protein 2-like [Sinocyclocheilus rhinocerous]
MDGIISVLGFLTLVLEGISCQGVYAPPTVQIVHSGHACNVEEERYSERVYTIREGETLELTCLVTGHPRPQIRWTKTAGSVSDRFQDSSVFNETLNIAKIHRHQGGRYYCKAENGLGSPAIKSIRVDVYSPASIKLLVEDPIVVNPGQTVSLVCISTGGEPAPSLNWTLSSGSLPQKSLMKDGTLTLPSIASEDAGVYSCVASNNVGNPAKKSTTIIVRALKKGRFWITPDPYHNDDNIQIGREVKISCQVEATPPEELQFSWLKNGRALRSSERMVITQTDPDISPGTTNLDIIDLKFTDFGTYTCVASLRGGGIPEISIDVNISSTTVPPNLTVPRGKSPMAVREGETVELECLVSGKPKPIILWSRADKEAPMPDGSMQTESYDGVLRIVNVSREMSGSYRCQTSQYNGFNVKPREAVIELIVRSSSLPQCSAISAICSELQLPESQSRESADPAQIRLRSGPVPPKGSGAALCRCNGSAFVLACSAISAICSELQLPESQSRESADPAQIRLRSGPVPPKGSGAALCRCNGSAFVLACSAISAICSELQLPESQSRESADPAQIRLRSGPVPPKGSGAALCRCTSVGKAYPPEFYYDTYNPLWQNRPRVYGYKLQWTQMNPNTVDRIMAYRLGIRQTGQQRWWEQEIPVEGNIQKGELITHNLTELIRPEAYVVRLTPITRFGEGDSSTRVVTYSDPINPHLSEYLFTTLSFLRKQRCGSKQGFYMYIETSRPRKEGDTARLLSPTFSVAPKNPYSISSPPAYCFSFYYHMYGKHIGTLNAFVKQKGQSTSDAGPAWSLSGNQGDRWRQAKISIHPTASFQVMFEGIRGPGIEGDIAIDDVTLEEGECPDPPSNPIRGVAAHSVSSIWPLSVTLFFTVFIGLR